VVGLVDAEDVGVPVVDVDKMLVLNFVDGDFSRLIKILYIQ
jgi:hypothetical protein